MEQIKWMLAGSFVLAVLLVTGCGGPHLGTVRMPLRHGDLDRSTSLIVTPVKVDALSFSGDAAGDAEKTTEARQRIERDLARLIAGELRAAGLNVPSLSTTFPPAIRTYLQRCDPRLHPASSLSPYSG